MTGNSGLSDRPELALSSTPGAVSRKPPRKAEEEAARQGLDQSQHIASRWRPRLSDRGDLDGPLFKDEFLREMWRERRRCERSASPLSMATFEVAPQHADSWLVVDKLVSSLSQAKRETDLLCQLDASVVAVLLPDTSRAGLQSFVDKVAATTNGLARNVQVATYPGDSLDRLIGDRVLPAENDADARAGGPAGYRLKRAFDIAGSIAGLLLFLPILVMTAVAVKLSSPGPVIYKQKRLGKGGEPFMIYKFRSMRWGADDKAHRDYVAALIRGQAEGARAGDGTVTYKIVADPRITSVGKFIRKTSIDELPQFFNVLKGDMSLVGPRPPTPYEVDNYQPWHLRRVFELKPGLTGIWQVEGRSRVTFDEMVRMDLRYLRRSSMMFDALILFRTVKVVLKCDGAE